jgi:purine nucleosidase
MAPRRLLIDTDTASDDAVALIMALRRRDLEVAAITVVWGNVPVEQGTQNALFVMEMCDAEGGPVFRGAGRPLAREPQHAQWFHGEDGLGDCGYRPRRRTVEAQDAVDAIVETVRRNPGIELVTLGPLTNVALALQRAPSLPGNVSRCVVMGGAACAVGNVTPAAEYNIWADPEAARAVFRSRLPIEMVGWELCRGAANISYPEMDEIRAVGTPFARFTIDCNKTAIEANERQSGGRGLALPDPVAMAIAIEPGTCTRHGRHYVDVECDSALTRGMTVVDELGVAEDERNRAVWAAPLARGPLTVCRAIDVARWKTLLWEALR